MNLKLIVIALLFSVSAMAQSTNFHSFTTKTIDGTNQNLADFKGKKVLVVNVA